MSQVYRCYTVCVIIGLLLPIGLCGQAFTSDEFFKNSLNNLHQLEVLSLDPITFPWIEEIDLRTETRDFDLDQQEVTLRISPSTPKIRRAQAALMAHYGSVPDEDKADQYSEVVLNLYGDWLSLYFIEKQLAITDSLSIILGDRKKILERQLGRLDIDLAELVELETDKNDLRQSSFELELERNILIERYGLANEALSFKELISLKEIKDNAIVEVLSSNPNAVALDKKNWQRDGIEKEIALEEAERKQLFDFLQFRYRGPDEDLFREKFSVGLGLTLRNSGNRKLKVASLIQEKRLLDKAVSLDADKQQARLTEILSELNYEIEKAEHFFKLKGEENKNLAELESLIKSKVGFNPQVVLRINEHKLKENLKGLEYLEDIYFEYLKYLSAKGQLSTVPFVNHLKA